MNEQMWNQMRRYIEHVPVTVLRESQLGGFSAFNPDDVAYKRQIDAAILNYKKQNSSSFKDMSMDELLAVFDDRVPVKYNGERENPKLSDIARRYLATYFMPAEIGFAARIVLMQTISILSIEATHDRQSEFKRQRLLA